MVKFASENPSNSRVKIEYDEDGEGSVTFEYPNKDNIFNVAFRTYCALIFKIFFLFILPITLFVISILVIFINASLVDGLLFVIVEYSVIIVVIFLLSTITTKNKLLLSLMPYINVVSTLIPFGTYQYVKVNKLESNVYEIPLFSNVYMKYKTHGDFNKYLKGVDVIEHKFYYIERSWIFGKMKKQKNDSLWHAKFYFTNIPKKGFLEVSYI